MDCASFERALEQVVSGEIDARERDGALADLREHVIGCQACRGVGELTKWMALSDAVRGRGWQRWVGAAAVVIAALLALWLVFAPVDDGRPSRQADAGSAGDTAETALELPSSLVEIIENDPTGLRDYGFGGDNGWSGPYDDQGWVFPDTEDLNPAARDELLQWLRERTIEGAGVRS